MGFKDFEIKLSGTSSVREYCVQYGESDLNFVSRLMKEEGYSYYFKHTDKKHTLVIVNQNGSFERCSDQGITYSRGTAPDNEINSWEHDYEFHKGTWTINDYNFKEPNKSQLAESLTQSKFTNAKNYKHYGFIKSCIYLAFFVIIWITTRNKHRCYCRLRGNHEFRFA